MNRRFVISCKYHQSARQHHQIVLQLSSFNCAALALQRLWFFFCSDRQIHLCRTFTEPSCLHRFNSSTPPSATRRYRPTLLHTLSQWNRFWRPFLCHKSLFWEHSWETNQLGSCCLGHKHMAAFGKQKYYVMKFKAVPKKKKKNDLWK